MSKMIIVLGKDKTWTSLSERGAIKKCDFYDFYEIWESGRGCVCSGFGKIELIKALKSLK